MKRLICILLTLTLALAGCAPAGTGETTAPTVATDPTDGTVPAVDVEPEPLVAKSSGVAPAEGEILITLSDDGVTIENASGEAVYTANDIVYYEAGHDFTYGEGEPGEEHTPEEAAAHTVVHITQPGSYRITGTLSAGQIAVDLGENAKEDPEAVVTLILDGVDITCTVAPAVIFYKVYECGVADVETATAIVDTSAAGANVIVAENSVNIVNGSYVARIYKEGTVVLSEDGTEVEEAKKLHKYDAAFYSKMSMNVDGAGILVINAENEGLDSELHLTINGGDIRIFSGNDGINTNEDYVSVTTINGGKLTITVTGETGEGDGIDSNGYLVINGGTVIASACGFSEDAGIDSDMGIYLNGGTVMAAGHMLDRIAGGDMTYAVFQFYSSQKGGVYTLRDADGDIVLECGMDNAFSYLILGSDQLAPGDYTLWKGDIQLAGSAGSGMGGGMPGGFSGGFVGEFPGGLEVQPPEGDYEIPPQPSMPVEQQGQRPDGDWQTDGEPPALPEGETWPEGEIPSQGGWPEGGTWPEGEIPSQGGWPEGGTWPEGEIPSQGGWPEGGTLPEGETWPQNGAWPQNGMIPGMSQTSPGGIISGEDQMTANNQQSTVFTLVKGANYFTVYG